MKVGIVGLGMLGKGVAQRLAERGHELAIYNRTEQKAKELEQSIGATLCDSPSEVATKSEFVITCLTDALAVKDVIFGDNGIAFGVHEKMVVGDMSTIDPRDSKHIASRMDSEFGTPMIGVPVMGGPDAARAGTLVVIADGDVEAFESCKSVLEDISQSIHHVGKNGTAHTIKLAMNLQIASLAVSISEGIELVRGGDVKPEKFLDILNSTYFGTGMSKKKAHKMIDGQYPATFLLRNLKKDLGLVTGFADSCGTNLEIVRAIDKTYADAVTKGLGELDYTGILEHIRHNRRN